MGRPPLPKADRRSKDVKAKLTPSEYRALVKDARAAGMTLGGYLRDLWLRSRKGG